MISQELVNCAKSSAKLYKYWECICLQPAFTEMLQNLRNAVALTTCKPTITSQLFRHLWSNKMIKVQINKFITVNCTCSWTDCYSYMFWLLFTATFKKHQHILKEYYHKSY